LTLTVLKIYLNSSKLPFEDASFDEDFDLRQEDGAYNYMAYLLSDQFDESIKVVRFRGSGDSGDLVVRKEFGKGCIFKVFYDLLTTWTPSKGALGPISTRACAGMSIFMTRAPSLRRERTPSFTIPTTPANSLRFAFMTTTSK